MKRLMMIIAIAVAANFATFGIQPASAVDAHHPAGATKGKKAKKPAAKKAKSSKSSGMMSCPMMHGGMTKVGMMHGHMKKNGMMTCRMMGGMQMMQPSGSQMGPQTMQHGEVMMGHRNPCWVMIDRDRGLGYSGACSH